MKNFSLNYLLTGIVLIFVTANLSCMSSKKLVYFNDLKDGTLTSDYKAPVPVIEKNDILSISVSSLNQQASAIFNTPNVPDNFTTTNLSENYSSSSGNQLNGYLVDFNGNIQFPVLGQIHAAGLTNDQLRDTITNELLARKLLVDPIVSIRNLNFKVTVLGEVNKPGVINVASDKISILEAIGLAGDLTIYGRRDNVLLIRQQPDGDKLIRHIDLGSSGLLTSPYFYLEPNDVLYVAPNKAKINSSTNAIQVWSIVITAMSFAALIVDRIIYH
jgi:polysaccharide biosynthesis/export protein